MAAPRIQFVRKILHAHGRDHDRPQWQYFGKEPARGGLRGRADARRAGFRLGEKREFGLRLDSFPRQLRRQDARGGRLTHSNNLIMQHLITLMSSRIPASRPCGEDASLSPSSLAFETMQSRLLYNRAARDQKPVRSCVHLF